MFSGVEKSLISKTPTLVDRIFLSQNKCWHGLTSSMQSSKSDTNSRYIEWCKSIAFSGKDSYMLGTAGLQSTHYVAFMRLSLSHFSPMDREGLEIPQAKKEVIRQFKRLRVVWFCLISHLFVDDVNIQSSRIDHYVRLFLSSCRRLWQSAQLDFTGDEFNRQRQPAQQLGNRRSTWRCVQQRSNQGEEEPELEGEDAGKKKKTIRTFLFRAFVRVVVLQSNNWWCQCWWRWPLLP